MGSDRNWVHVDFISEIEKHEDEQIFTEKKNNGFYFGPDELKVFVDIHL